MSQEELAAIEIASRKQRELEEIERDHFLEWVRETAEAEEQTELRQRIRDLELENDSLREFSEPDNADTKGEFEKDLILSDEAEVLSDILADELDTVIESTDAPRPAQEEIEQLEQDEED